MSENGAQWRVPAASLPSHTEEKTVSKSLLALALAALPVLSVAACPAEPDAIKQLDNEYQAAVAKNDAVAMDRLLADDFTLVTGKGKVYGKADLLAEARSGQNHYEQQDDNQQQVHIYGDTAIVTALLWVKLRQDGKPVEYKLWFSDVYVCTPAGWRYAFGQAAQPLRPA